MNGKRNTFLAVEKVDNNFDILFPEHDMGFFNKQSELSEEYIFHYKVYFVGYSCVMFVFVFRRKPFIFMPETCVIVATFINKYKCLTDQEYCLKDVLTRYRLIIYIL